MKRIVIRHLSGARANQTDALELDHVREIVLGRDPGANIKFDPDRDDLVSRLHAKIVRLNTDPPIFSITDLKSQNGTYVNGKIVRGSVDLNPGDIIQLGEKGPQLSFDIEPRVANSPPPTRQASGDETRGVTAGSTADARHRTAANNPRPPGADPVNPKASVGRATVERMISQIQRQSRSRTIAIGSLFGLILLSAVGWFAYQSNVNQQQAENKRRSELEETKKQHKETLKRMEENRPVSSAEIAEKFSASTVLIEMSWKLMHVSTGRQVYHRWGSLCLKPSRRGCLQRTGVSPFYSLQSGNLEPYLTVEEAGNNPIGGQGSGSGFVVSVDGLILTNRHVAAPWETRYWSGGQPPLPGFLEECADADCTQYIYREVSAEKTSQSYLRSLGQWVPTKSIAFGGKPASGKTSDGKHLYLDVVFPNTTQRISARLARVSDHADTALIKIDTVKPLAPVEFGDAAVRAGDSITVLGYPGVSPDLTVKIRSEDTFNREAEWKTIPQPTVTGGNIGKVLTGKNLSEDESITDYYGQFTEAYQLTVNATGSGNSGGPVFDERARVIGIFTAGSSYGGAAITFAVPIKFGQELMAH